MLKLKKEQLQAKHYHRQNELESIKITKKENNPNKRNSLLVRRFN